jgi:integrase/recombinase XerD
MCYNTDYKEILFMEIFEKYDNKLIMEYEQSLRNIKVPKPYSDKTITAYCDDINRFLNFVNKPVSEVTKDDVGEFLLEGAPSTSRRRFSSILNFYNYLNIDNKPITKDDYDSLVRQDPERTSVRMTIPEGLKFLEVAKADGVRTFAAMMVFLNTGVRESELCNLLRSDFSVDNLRVIGKGDKERNLSIIEEVAIAVNDYLKTRTDNEPYLFISNKGSKYSPTGMYNLVKEIAARTGIEKEISPHTLRHTFAAMMWDKGLDPVQIMEILGHSSIRTTLIYIGKLGIKKAKELMKLSAFNVR